MVELREVMFDNVHKILKLKPADNQKEFVEDVSTTIAIAYAGINEKCPGNLHVIYYDNEPVGIILIGRAVVAEQEPEILKNNKYVYRLMGFFIDANYQHKGIGRKALNLALEKIETYSDGNSLPIALEVKIQNRNAINLYQSLGFYDTGMRYGDDCVFVRLPQNS